MEVSGVGTLAKCLSLGGKSSWAVKGYFMDKEVLSFVCFLYDGNFQAYYVRKSGKFNQMVLLSLEIYFLESLMILKRIHLTLLHRCPKTATSNYKWGGCKREKLLASSVITCLAQKIKD